MPIFRVKSVKIYTGQKNLHGHVRGVRDKYEVWICVELVSQKFHTAQLDVTIREGYK